MTLLLLVVMSMWVVFAVFRYNQASRIQARRLRFVTIRMRFLQLAHVGVIPRGKLFALLDTVTRKSVEDKKGTTLWEVARKRVKQNDEQVESAAKKLIDSVKASDDAIQELFIDYVT